MELGRPDGEDNGGSGDSEGRSQPGPRTLPAAPSARMGTAPWMDGQLMETRGTPTVSRTGVDGDVALIAWAPPPEARRTSPRTVVSGHGKGEKRGRTRRRQEG